MRNQKLVLMKDSSIMENKVSINIPAISVPKPTFTGEISNTVFENDKEEMQKVITNALIKL